MSNFDQTNVSTAILLCHLHFLFTVKVTQAQVEAFIILRPVLFCWFELSDLLEGRSKHNTMYFDGFSW